MAETSAANKGRSVVNYHQFLAFEHPCLSCSDYCDQYYYFPEIILNDLELAFLEYSHFYKTHRISLFSFYLFIFYSLFSNYSVY